MHTHVAQKFLCVGSDGNALAMQYNVYGKVYAGTEQIWEAVKGGMKNP